jgi:hypothetical protein
MNGGGSIDHQLAARLLAADDVIQSFSAFSGDSNLTMMYSQIQRARDITLTNLKNFSDVFGKNISRTLLRLNQWGKDLGASGESFLKTKAEICLMLAAAPVWPKDVPFELCENVQLLPFIGGGPSSVRLTSATHQLTQKDRACFYRDYMRASKIYQDFKAEIRLKSVK